MYALNFIFLTLLFSIFMWCIVHFSGSIALSQRTTARDGDTSSYPEVAIHKAMRWRTQSIVEGSYRLCDNDAA